MRPGIGKAPYLLIALILATMLMAACSQAGLAPAGAKDNPPPPSGSAPSGSSPDSSTPFITWDQETTVPFLCYAIDRAAGEDRAFLGLWDLSAGKVSFSDKPLFQTDQWTGYGEWDGGNRFLFRSDKVTNVDPRISVESFRVPYSKEWWTDGLIAAPSDSDAVFAVYCGEGGKPVLDIRNHPLEGKITLDLPILPPETRIARPVGIEVSDARVNVYFETSRLDVDPQSGERDLVQGVVRATYDPAVSLHPVQWRVVNPEVPSFVAGSGTSYAQIDDGLVLSREYHTSEFLDVASGIVSDVPGFVEAIKEADPGFDEPYVEDRCYGYKDLRFVITHYERAAEGWVTQVLAFRGETALGRIECVDSSITVFKGTEKTQETVRPWKNAGSTWDYQQQSV